MAQAAFDVAQDFAVALAERLGDDLVRVGLFGSRARGDSHLRSDYDLMVVLCSASRQSRDAVHRLATTLELEHNVDLSIKVLDRERFEQLRQSSPAFWRNYAHDERVLWPRTSLRSA